MQVLLLFCLIGGATASDPVSNENVPFTTFSEGKGVIFNQLFAASIPDEHLSVYFHVNISGIVNTIENFRRNLYQQLTMFATSLDPDFLKKSRTCAKEDRVNNLCPLTKMKALPPRLVHKYLNTVYALKKLETLIIELREQITLINWNSFEPFEFWNPDLAGNLQTFVNDWSIETQDVEESSTFALIQNNLIIAAKTIFTATYWMTDIASLITTAGLETDDTKILPTLPIPPDNDTGTSSFAKILDLSFFSIKDMMASLQKILVALENVEEGKFPDSIIGQDLIIGSIRHFYNRKFAINLDKANIINTFFPILYNAKTIQVFPPVKQACDTESLIMPYPSTCSLLFTFTLPVIPFSNEPPVLDIHNLNPIVVFEVIPVPTKAINYLDTADWSIIHIDEKFLLEKSSTGELLVVEDVAETLHCLPLPPSYPRKICYPKNFPNKPVTKCIRDLFFNNEKAHCDTIQPEIMADQVQLMTNDAVAISDNSPGTLLEICENTKRSFDVPPSFQLHREDGCFYKLIDGPEVANPKITDYLEIIQTHQNYRPKVVEDFNRLKFHFKEFGYIYGCSFLGIFSMFFLILFVKIGFWFQRKRFGRTALTQVRNYNHNRRRRRRQPNVSFQQPDRITFFQSLPLITPRIQQIPGGVAIQSS